MAGVLHANVVAVRGVFEKDTDLAHTVVVVDHFGRGSGIHRVVQQVEQCREFGGKGSAVGIEQARNIDVYFVALRRGRVRGGGVGTGAGTGVVRGIGSGFLLSRGDDNIL